MVTTNKEKYIIPILSNSTVIICPGCGRLVQEYFTGDSTGKTFCNCNSKQPEGWLCPRCGAGVSPKESKCPCTEPAFRLS